MDPCHHNHAFISCPGEEHIGVAFGAGRQLHGNSLGSLWGGAI